MPRRRQQKVLAPVPEDEELVEESSEENLKGIDDAVMQLIDGLEHQGKRFGLCILHLFPNEYQQCYSGFTLKVVSRVQSRNVQKRYWKQQKQSAEQ